VRGDAFKAAVEARDEAALAAALSADVTFRSPAVFRPYVGRDLVMVVLSAAATVFEGLRYERRFEAEDGEALKFSARIGDRELDGVDLLRFDAVGLVTELTVMVRPLSGLNALVAAMGRELERRGVTAPGRSRG